MRYIWCDIVVYDYTHMMMEGGLDRSESIAIDGVITIVKYVMV